MDFFGVNKNRQLGNQFKMPAPLIGTAGELPDSWLTCAVTYGYIPVCPHAKATRDHATGSEAAHTMSASIAKHRNVLH
jgi:hypothetical protein